ncbi:unnamed protein product, partial [Ectocarpus sp. 12 AP-2014]
RDGRSCAAFCGGEEADGGTGAPRDVEEHDVQKGEAAVRAHAARPQQASRGGGATQGQAQEARGPVRRPGRHGEEEEEEQGQRQEEQGEKFFVVVVVCIAGRKELRREAVSEGETKAALPVFPATVIQAIVAFSPSLSLWQFWASVLTNLLVRIVGRVSRGGMTQTARFCHPQ